MKASLLALLIIGANSHMLQQKSARDMSKIPQNTAQYAPERASVHGDQDLYYTVNGDWKTHDSQLKGRKQGREDDGEDDSWVLSIEGSRKKSAAPPTKPHVWHEYEPHTTSRKDQFQGYFH